MSDAVTMGSIPLPTEARIFARQVIREVRRREPVGASAMAGKPVKAWEDATFPLFRRLERDTGVFTRSAMAACRRRLDALPAGERGYACGPTSDPKAYLDIITAMGGGHSLTAMEGLEDGVVLQRHCFDIRKTLTLFAGVVVANVSSHALGRYYERLAVKPDIEAGIMLALVCGRLGMIASTIQELGHSELNLAADDVLVTGSMKVAAPLNRTGFATGFASAFFDCRTILPIAAADDAQLGQARVIDDCFGGKAEPASIPVIARRPDFVLATLAASNRPKH